MHHLDDTCSRPAIASCCSLAWAQDGSMPSMGATRGMRPTGPPAESLRTAVQVRAISGASRGCQPRSRWPRPQRPRSAGLDFRKANLIGTRLVGAQLDGADLFSCDLTDAVASDASFEGANLDGSTLRRADLRRRQSTRRACSRPSSRPPISATRTSGRPASSATCARPTWPVPRSPARTSAPIPATSRWESCEPSSSAPTSPGPI